MSILDKLDEAEKAAMPGPWINQFGGSLVKNITRLGLTRDSSTHQRLEKLLFLVNSGDLWAQKFVEDLKSRLQSKIEIQKSGCWQWQGAVNVSGYGTVGFLNRCTLAHRLSYWVFQGPIPEKLATDHVCCNRLCINPGHLRPVTWKENTLRGTSFSAENARKTHCKNGHELTGSSVHLSETGRVCRVCRRINYNKRHAENPEKRNARQRELYQLKKLRRLAKLEAKDD